MGFKAVRTDSDRTFHVADYGMGGGATDETTKLQAAIDACNAAGGGVVQLLPRDATITSVTRPGPVILRGYGRNVSILKSAFAGSKIVSPDPAVRVYRGGLYDFTLDGIDRNIAGAVGLDLRNVSELDSEGVRVENVEEAIRQKDAAYYNHFRNVTTTGTKKGWTFAGGGGNAGSVVGGRAHDTVDGAIIDGCSQLLLEAFSIETFTGVGVKIGQNAATVRVKLDDLRCENAPTSGVGIDFGALAQRTILEDPHFAGLTTRITGDAAAIADSFIESSHYANPRIALEKLFFGSGDFSGGGGALNALMKISGALVAIRNGADSGYVGTDQLSATLRAVGNALIMGEGADMFIGTVTGSKIGTGVNAKIGFWGNAPGVQPAAVADAAGGAVVDVEARAAINACLARLRSRGSIAS